MIRDILFAIELTSKLLKDKDLKLNNVVERISQESTVPIEEILGKSRRQHIVTLRQTAYYVYRHRFGLTYSSIADLTNRLDHTTVMHGLKTMENYLQVYGIHTDKPNLGGYV